MYQVSASWENAVKHSHTALARIDVERGGQVTSFKVAHGTVTQDYDDPTRWGFDVEVIDEQKRAFDTMKDLVDPFTSKITPWAGIRYPNGTEEWVPNGRMYVKDLDVGETDGAVTWRLNSFDASSRLKSKMASPFAVPGGVDPTSVIVPMLHPRFPPLSIVATRTKFVSQPLIIREGSSAWDEARKLVGACGLDLVVNRVGVGVMTGRIADAYSVRNPAWSFDENDRSDFADTERRVTLDDKPNVVIVTGTHPSAPGVFGIAFDNDPRSDTFRYGPKYGEQVYQEDSERVFTNQQATEMAQWLLSKKLGPQDQVTFNAIRNPALDVGDVVEVSRARMGFVGTRMIVTHIECPLTVDEWMRVTCRRSIYTNAEGQALRP